MAYEPTKNFRQIVRQLVPGDHVIAVGSFKKGSINLEKLKVNALQREPQLVHQFVLVQQTNDQRWKGERVQSAESVGHMQTEPETMEISAH